MDSRAEDRRRMTMARIGALAAVLLASVAAATPAAQAGREIVFNYIDYPRPVSEAVRQVEKHFGTIITYEDIAYRDPADVVDVTEQVRRDASPPRVRLFGMRGGTLDFRYTPRAADVSAQVEEVLQQVLTHSRQVGNLGDFRIERRAGGFHVVPTTAKNRAGEREAYESPLERRITLTPLEGRAMEVFDHFAGVLSTPAGPDVGLGLVPTNLFMQKRVRVEAENEKARDVLWRALQSIDPALSWQLLCDVRDTCALNIYLVNKRDESVR